MKDKYGYKRHRLQIGASEGVMFNSALSYRRWFSIIIAFLFTLNSNAQKDSIMKEFMKNIPAVTADYEFINGDSIFGNDKTSEPKMRIAGNDTIYFLHTSPHSYSEQDKSGKQTRRIWKGDYGFSETIFSSNPRFKTQKRYYPTGGIKDKGVFYSGGMKVGLWYHYDEKGNLIEMVDHDEGFDFTLEDVLAYRLNNHFPVPWEKIGIEKLNEGKVKAWYVSYVIERTKFTTILDAKTGAVIERRTYEYPLGTTDADEVEPWDKHLYNR